MVDYLEVRKIRLSSRPLRTTLGSLEGLATSIMERGLLQPVVVRPICNEFEVVAGNRRLAACKMLGMHRVLCHVVELNDQEALEVSLIENVQHQTLNPLEEATGFRDYVRRFGHGGVSDLARKIGKSPTYVSRRISLLASEDVLVQQLLRRRKIPVSVAHELVSMDDETRTEITHYAESHKITRRQIREIAKTRRTRDHDSEFDYRLDPEEAQRRSIDRALDRCITSLRICMNRIDGVLEYLNGENWPADEAILHYRVDLHEHIDEILKLKRRTGHFQRRVLRHLISRNLQT